MVGTENGGKAFGVRLASEWIPSHKPIKGLWGVLENWGVCGGSRVFFESGETDDLNVIGIRGFPVSIYLFEKSRICGFAVELY